MPSFTPGTVLQRGDIDIFLADSGGNPLNVYEITYALYFVDPIGPPVNTEVLIGSATRSPVNPTMGEYYTSLMVPPSATLGTYRVRWSFKETSGSVQQQVVQEFTVADKTALVTLYSSSQQAMIRSLRILIRDINPDRHYKFRPPEHESVIGNFNQVFGHIWEDYELLEYLQRSLDWWNMFPPETEEICNLDKLISNKPTWRTIVLWGAIIFAATALAFNWTADEFSVSGDTEVRLKLSDGSIVDVPIEELWEITKGVG